VSLRKDQAPTMMNKIVRMLVLATDQLDKHQIW